MQRGQESPWLKFMENKGRSLLEWSENYPAGQLTIWGQTGNAYIEKLHEDGLHSRTFSYVM
jgi:hypothetical protein